MRCTPLLLAALLLTAADRPTGADALAEQVHGRVAGRSVDCIDPHDVVSVRVIDGTAIVYDELGSLYVNRPAGAEHLRWDDVLFTRIDGAQLCRLDTIRLLDPETRGIRGFVVLGPFTPYRRAK